MNKIPPSVFKEALRLLGAKETGDLTVSLERAYETLMSVAKPRTVYKRVAAAQTEHGVMLDNTEFAGSDLKKLFAHSEEAFLLAATLGAETDALIRTKMSGDMAEAALLDVCANAEVERVCDILEKELFDVIGKGKYLTRRFSPGYGDLPLKYSSVIVNALNTQKYIGLSTTQASMLVPIKSVTAMIGISSVSENRGRRCEECAANDSCIWQKRGERCGI